MTLEEAIKTERSAQKANMNSIKAIRENEYLPDDIDKNALCDRLYKAAECAGELADFLEELARYREIGNYLDIFKLGLDVKNAYNKGIDDFSEKARYIVENGIYDTEYKSEADEIISDLIDAGKQLKK